VVLHGVPRLSLQVFTNLIFNAAEYAAREHGVVDVVLAKDSAVVKGCVFSVRDNGVGISAEDRPRIFSKFFRSEAARRARPQGSGLGLFIVRLLCEKFGWQVWFESPPLGHAKGTVFVVCMPPASA
jgi:signal transduction histidine kinase